MRRALLGVVLFVLLAAPVQALLVPSYDFQGELAITSFAKESKNNTYAIFTGSAQVTGPSQGLFTFLQTSQARVHSVGRLEVYDTSGSLGSIDLQEFRRTGRPVHRVYEDATLSFASNTTFLYHTDQERQPANVSVPFAFGVALRPPQEVSPNRLVNLTAGPSFALVGDGRASIEWEEADAAAYVYVPDRTTQVTVRSGSTGDTYTGNRYLFRLMDSASVDVPEARAVLVPLEGNTTVALTPAQADALEGGFDLSRLNTTVRLLFPNTTNAPSLPIPSQLQQALGSVSPLFNGALVGNPRGNLTIDGHNRSAGSLSLLRYSEVALRLDPEDEDRLRIQGQGPFLLVGDSLYSDKKVVGPPLFPLPILSLTLWLFAAFAIVLRIAMKPFIPSSPANAAAPIRLASLLARWGLAALAFLLWDLETRAFIGTSFLTMVFVGPRDGLGLGVVLLFQFIPYSLAALFFGLPVRFITNALLRLANMKSARGVGKGLGYLGAWGLGAPHFPLLLAPMMGLLSKTLGQGLG